MLLQPYTKGMDKVSYLCPWCDAPYTSKSIRYDLMVKLESQVDVVPHEALLGSPRVCGCEVQQGV